VNAIAAPAWNGNSGIPEPPPEEEVELERAVDVEVEPVLAAEVDDAGEVDVTEEVAEVVEEVEDDMVEVLVVVDVSAASGTTETEESPLIATNTSPVAVS
jgi:hypothetical protein